MNAPTRSTPAASEPTTSGSPSRRNCRGRAPDDPEGGGADQPEAGEIEAGVAAEALLDPAEDERDRGEADQDVDPEDPLPGDPLDDRAADERAEGDRDPGDRAEEADRRPLFSGGKAALRRARPRVSTSAAPAPWTARAAISQPTSGASAQAADAAANRAESSGIEPPAPVAIAERRRRDQEHGDAQVVGVHRPLQVLDRGAEIEPDRAQRGRHHQGVQGGHQRADCGQGDHPCCRSAGSACAVIGLPSSRLRSFE